MDHIKHFHCLNRSEVANLFLYIAAPGGYVILIFFLEAVHPKRGRKCEAGVLKPLFNRDTVSLVHIARATAALHGSAAARAVKRHFFRCQRQDAVVL